MEEPTSNTHYIIKVKNQYREKPSNEFFFLKSLGGDSFCSSAIPWGWKFSWFTHKAVIFQIKIGNRIFYRQIQLPAKTILIIKNYRCFKRLQNEKKNYPGANVKKRDKKIWITNN